MCVSAVLSVLRWVSEFKKKRGRQRECWAARLHVAMREEKRGKGALTVSPLPWYTSCVLTAIPGK